MTQSMFSSRAIASRPMLDGISVLVVDDDPAVASSVSAGLQSRHASVELATSLSAAAALLDEGLLPDFVVLDLSLRDGFGLQLTDRLHAQRCAFAILSGSALFHLEAVLRAGASDILVKPVDLDDLVAAAAEGARRTRTLRERFPPRACRVPSRSS